MSDDALVQRVGRWLDAVPHSECDMVHIPHAAWQVWGSSEDLYTLGPRCTCDRAARQAAAVVRLARESAVQGFAVLAFVVERTPKGISLEPGVAGLCVGAALDREVIP